MDLLKAFTFRSGAAKMRAEHKKLCDELEARRKRWEHLRSVPLPVEEQLDTLCAVLHRRAADWYERALAQRLTSLGSDPIAHHPDSQQFVMSAILTQGQQLNGREVEGMLAFFFPAEVRAGLQRALEATAMKCGSSRAAREQEIEQLDQEIAKLEAEGKALAAEMASLARDFSG